MGKESEHGRERESAKPTDKEDPQGRAPSGPQAFFRAAELASLGLEMGLAVAIGAGAGYFGDSKLGTSPWLLLLGLLFGVAAGFKGMIDAAKKANPASKPRPPEGKGENNGSETARHD